MSNQRCLLLVLFVLDHLDPLVDMAFVKFCHYELGTAGFRKLLWSNQSRLFTFCLKILAPEMCLFNCFPIIFVCDRLPIFAFKFELKTKYEANGFRTKTFKYCHLECFQLIPGALSFFLPKMIEVLPVYLLPKSENQPSLQVALLSWYWLESSEKRGRALSWGNAYMKSNWKAFSSFVISGGGPSPWWVEPSLGCWS